MKKVLSVGVSLLVLALLIILSGACVSQTKDENKSTMGKEDTTGSMNNENKMTIDYDTQVKPIIASRCDACHPGRSAKYASLKNDAYTEKVKKYVSSDRMPKDGPLSAEQKKIVLSWLDSLLGAGK